MTENWNEIWKTRMTRSMESRGNSAPVTCPGYWDSPERARDYLKNYGSASDERGTREILVQQLNLKPGSHVLEIGPGPGVLTIPIARQVARVTAVEPSSGMATVLHEQIAAENIGNVTVIQKRWEDIGPSDLGRRYDLVLASYSLGMHDLKAAIEKMVAACQGKIVLFWHADIPQFERLYSLVWPSLFGADYIPVPKSDVLFNVLYEMGIYPCVEYHEFYQKQTFPSVEHLRDYFRYQHYLEYDPSLPGFQEYCQQYIGEDNGVITHHERLPGMVFQWHAGCNGKKLSE